MKDNSAFETEALTALVGSRLCHDLINPLGAIGNGVELLGMAAGSLKPEMALIADAVRDAQSRIRFFRIAFGHADASSMIGRREIDETLAGLYGHGGRLSVDWDSASDLMRQDAKVGLLMLACAESAMPLGGMLRLTESQGTFRMEAEAKRLNLDDDLWATFQGAEPGRKILSSEVHFVLFAREVLKQDRIVKLETSDTSIIASA